MDVNFKLTKKYIDLAIVGMVIFALILLVLPDTLVTLLLAGSGMLIVTALLFVREYIAAGERRDARQEESK